METGEPPRHVCPGDPFARKYTGEHRETLNINDSRLYENGAYIHYRCMQDTYGFKDREGNCTKDLGACLAQGDNGMCACRDRAIKTTHIEQERAEIVRRQEALDDLKRGCFRKD